MSYRKTDWTQPEAAHALEQEMNLWNRNQRAAKPSFFKPAPTTSPLASEVDAQALAPGERVDPVNRFKK